MDQADHGRRPALGEPIRRGAIWFELLHDYGLPRMHVSAGVIYLLVIAFRVRNGFYERRGGNYEIVEITGLYWHFVDLVWVFIFAFFYLW